MKTFVTSGTGSQQSLQNIHNEKVPVYDSISDAQSDLANLEEGQIIATKENTAVSQLLDALYPVGVTYLQFPTCESPVDLFPTLTWTEINFDGAFFRASGTNADAFIGVGGTLIPQGQATAKNGLSVSVDSNSSLTGYAGAFSGAGFVQGNAAIGGICSLGTYRGNAYQGAGGSPGYDLSINANHGHTCTVSGDSETRPVNYTVKVWKRTA